MNGYHFFITLAKELTLHYNFIPKGVSLDISKQNNNTKIHYKNSEGKVQRLLIPMKIEEVREICIKRSTV